MAVPARNALKGYTYQQYVLTLFVAIMDTEREISSIESETIVDHNFDDLLISAEQDYRVQIKNYPKTKIEEIEISDNVVKIKQNMSKRLPDENNIVVINSDCIETNSLFMGLPCIIKNSVIIIPITADQIEAKFDLIFCDEYRMNQIINFCYRETIDAKFKIIVDDLPQIVKIKQDLDNKTIIVRKPIESWEIGITCILGKPGVGKSHYVNELIDKYSDAIVYRFWINSQDVRLKDRLSFDYFLNDIAKSIFHSSKKYTEEDIINQIKKEKIKIIIDGLDHIENYNKYEFDKYVNFINCIKDSYIIVLTRPLKITITWNTINLENWSKEEMSRYVNEEYNICDYKTVFKLYEISGGYPIIVYFLCEHYKIYDEFIFLNKIVEINAYYDLLLNDVNTKSCLEIFTITDSFILDNELDMLLENSLLANIVREFIINYPYLFTKIENRISLIHDSFNTYLRNNCSNINNLDVAITKIQDSIMALEVRYLSRISDIHFKDDFYKTMLIKYSNKESFYELINSTIDYFSIVEFYKHARNILNKYDNILDVYQYYSFALIFETVTRNDLVDNEELLYELIVYWMNNIQFIEEKIFSSGALWHLFLSVKNNDIRYYKRFLDSTQYGSFSRIDKLIEKIYNENHYFEDKKLTVENYIEIIEKNGYRNYDNNKIIVELLVSEWINKTGSPFHLIMDEYISSKDINLAKYQLYDLIGKYVFDNRFIDTLVTQSIYKIKELGLLEDENELVLSSLHEIILDNIEEGSFIIQEIVLSYIRLANHQNREVDILSINNFFNMHYAHKDYSIFNLDTALICFEKHCHLNEDISINLIINAMKQAERGASHLYNNYIYKKDDSIIEKIYSDPTLYQTRLLCINDLSPKKIELIPEKIFFDEMTRFFSIRSRSKFIKFGEINNILTTCYSDFILATIKKGDFTLYDVDENSEIVKKFGKLGIKFEYYNSSEREDEYVPFKYNCISEFDFDYIKENRVDYLEISKLTGTQYDCFPYVDIFSIYDKNDIQKDFLKIIHNLLFAKASSGQYIGNWYLVLGHIPLFLSEYDINIEWGKLFDIFKFFVDVSLLCDNSTYPLLFPPR